MFQLLELVLLKLLEQLILVVLQMLLEQQAQALVQATSVFRLDSPSQRLALPA